ERYVILSNLRDGQPARWPEGVTDDQRTQAKTQFGLGDAKAQGDSTGRDSLFWLWLALLVLAGAIPSLSIFYKFTMSAELKAYYSLACQAGAGNTDAILQLRSRGALGSN